MRRAAVASAASRPPRIIRPMARFCPGAGHQLGFNDLKAIEMAGFADAMAGRGPETFSFRDGLRSQILMETIRRSSRERRWLPVET